MNTFQFISVQVLYKEGLHLGKPSQIWISPPPHPDFLDRIVFYKYFFQLKQDLEDVAD